MDDDWEDVGDEGKGGVTPNPRQCWRMLLCYRVRWGPTRREAGGRIKKNEVGACEEFCDQGTPCLRKCTCCLKVLGVEISQDDVIMEVKKNVKVRCQIGRTSG